MSAEANFIGPLTREAYWRQTPPGLPHPPQDIGPGSLLWDYLGDKRMAFTGPSAGLLQLMHPAISAGVVEHSNFFNDPWDRIYRSIPQILQVVYDPQGEAVGRTIRNYHSGIKGIDSHGQRYHALNPETYWWAHATFHNMVEGIIDRFDRRVLSPNDREQLYQESNTWYSRYAVSTRPVPADYAGFREKWDDITSNMLEMTPAAAWTLEKIESRTAIPLPDQEGTIWSKSKNKTANEIVRLLAIGGLPATVRDRLAIPWSKKDEAKLKTIEGGIKHTWPFLPHRRRYHSQARAGMAAAGQV